MWQRKQTVYLIASLAAIIICLLSPIGSVEEPTGMGASHLLTNLGFTKLNVDRGLPAWPLFIFVNIAGIISIVDIFLFKNRKLQMRMCSYAMIADILWYVYYAIFYMQFDLTIHVSFAACLPLVSCILLWLAKKGIKADDDLVRSMDRIR